MLTNLWFYNSKSFFSVFALLSWVIFIKNTDKSIYTPLYWYLVAYMFLLNYSWTDVAVLSSI